MDNKEFQNVQKKLRMTNERSSEVLGVSLFTVQQWASGIWMIPKPIVNFLRVLQENQRLRDAIQFVMRDIGRDIGRDTKHAQEKHNGTLSSD